MDPINPSNVTAAEARAGWSINEQNGRKFKSRIWKTTGISNGIYHESGENMKTWEVIADTGAFSYDIMANAKYQPAMRALNEEILKRSKNGNKRRKGLV